MDEEDQLIQVSPRHAVLVGAEYAVWIKKAPGATSAEIYQELQERSIPLERLTDVTPALLAAKDDAMLQGINGALTMAFIAAMAVCLTGSLISWILSFQARILQFGIFRAIGLSRRSVIGMIVGEQLLTSVVAIAAGIVIGGVAADLFVPLLAVTQATGQQAPPFRVVAAASELKPELGGSPHDADRDLTSVGHQQLFHSNS